MEPKTQTPTSMLTPGTTIELSNGRIVDVVNGQYLPGDVRIILREGRIQAMPGLPGEPGDLHGDVSIDLQGKAVIPGLFNTHCHLQMKYPSMLASPRDLTQVRKLSAGQIEKNLADCQARGMTHLRDTLTSDLRPNRVLQRRITCGELPGPRLHQCVLVTSPGGTYSSPPSLFDFLLTFLAGAKPQFNDPASGVVVFPSEATGQQVRQAIDLAIDERRANSIKLYDQREFVPTYKPGAQVMTQAQLDAAADQARRRGIPCTMHHATVESFQRGARAGVTSLAHLPLDAALSSDDVRAFKNAGGIIEPTVSLAYFLSWNMPGAPWLDHPRLKRLNEWRAQNYADLMNEFWLPGLLPSAMEMFVKAQRGEFKMFGLINAARPFLYWGGQISQGTDNLLMLLEEGVPIACSTDAGAVPASEAMIGLEIALLALLLNPENGPAHFTPADALRAATLHSARALGVEQDFGSIRSGKVADLALLDGDPLQDIAQIGHPVAALFVAGQLVANSCGLQFTA
jgi:imidazolonepropionase-like amidohydrolase